LKFADIEDFNTHIHYPDVFDKEFEDWADYMARSVCVDMADDQLLLGYADVPVPAITADKPGAGAEGLDLDEPYEDCVSRMQEFNRNRLYSTALGGDEAREDKP
jgi:hypothetical protein